MSTPTHCFKPCSKCGKASTVLFVNELPSDQQNIEDRAPIDCSEMTSSPVSRIVYNGKRNSSPRSPTNTTEIFTPAHEENVRFIYEAWQCVERDLRSQITGSDRGLVEEYVEKNPNVSLKSFKPVDLSDMKRRSTQDAKKS